MSKDVESTSESTIRSLCIRPLRGEWVTITHAGRTMRVRWITRYWAGKGWTTLQFEASEDWHMLRDSAIRPAPAEAAGGEEGPAGPVERRRGA
jgi:hypothetical protein